MTTRLNRLQPIIDKIQNFDLSKLELVPWRENNATEKYGQYRKLYYNFVVPVEGTYDTFFTLYYQANYDEGTSGYTKSEWTIELFNDVRFDKYDFDVGFRIHVEEFAKVQKYESDADDALTVWGFDNGV